MYYRLRANHLILRQSDTSEDIPVPLEDFAFISALSFSPWNSSLLLTGVVRGEDLPNPHKDVNRRGQQKLFRWKLDERRWALLHKGYSHDPAPIPGTGHIAFSSGNGLMIVSEHGDPLHEYRLGNFSWGAPSLSASPDGGRVAMIKWREDDQKLCVYDLKARSGTVYKPSCHRYCWYDESRLLYYRGSRLKLLEVSTGKSSSLVADWAEALRILSASTPNHPATLFTGEDVTYWLGELRATADRVYSALSALHRSEGYRGTHGLFSLEKGQKKLRLEHICQPNQRIVRIDLSEVGNVVLWLENYDQGRIVSRERAVIGAGDVLLKQGWDLLSSGLSPEFGVPWLSLL